MWNKGEATMDVYIICGLSCALVLSITNVSSHSTQVPNPAKFPQGLAPVIEYVHSKGKLHYITVQ